MRQQINLYQPIFREQRKLVSARVVAIALGAVSVTLCAIYGFASWQVRSLASQLEVLRVERKVNDTRIASLGALQGERSKTQDIEQKIAALSLELSLRTRALQALQSGDTGQTTGFALKFEALARGHIEGLWLDHVVLAAGRSAMSLSGGTTDPALVPRYLQGLATEAALAGARFDEFVIENPRPTANPALIDPKPVSGSLRFRAGSSAVGHADAKGAT